MTQVREIAMQLTGNRALNWKLLAIEALQEASESYLVGSQFDFTLLMSGQAHLPLLHISCIQQVRKYGVCAYAVHS